MSYPVSRPIWTDHMIDIPVNWMCNGDKRQITIQFDPTVTQILSASLNVRVASDYGDGYAVVEVNGSEIMAFYYDDFEGGIWKEQTKDISSMINVGENIFACNVCTNDILHFMGRRFWVYGTLTITYEGIPPDVTDPKDANDDLWTALKELVIWGGLAVIGVYVAVKVVPPLLGVYKARRLRPEH